MDEINHLNQARALVEADVSHCPTVIKGMLEIVSSNESVAVRRWCSLFFLDAFTIFDQPTDTLIQLSVDSLDSILMLLKDKDEVILKNTIMTAATVYPLGFLYVCNNQGSDDVWAKLKQLKQTCNALWNEYSKKQFGIEAPCIKFAQQVVRVQTFGTRDPRLVQSDDISMSSVPPGHPLAQDVALEAESSGLLDKILSIFSDKMIYEPRVTCAIHAVNILLRSRPSTHRQIMRAILNFDTSTKSVAPEASDLRAEMEFKFVDRALKVMLASLLKKRLLPSQYASQVENYLSTLSQGRASEKLKKRLAESEEDSSHKRIKLERSTTPVNSSTTMPPGPASYTSLFNLLGAGDPLESFDVKELPPEIAINIAFTSIANVNDELLQNSVGVVQQRLKFLQDQESLQPNSTYDQYPVDSFDENDDNEFDPAKRGEDGTMMGIDDGGADDDDMEEQNLLPASEFSLPPVEKLSHEQKVKAMGQVVERLIGYGSISGGSGTDATAALNTNKGIDRVALGGGWKNDTWVLFASRLLTRGICTNSGLEDEVRERIYRYVMANYRERLEIILTWLTEEWYSEFVIQQLPSEKADTSNYYTWTSKLFDAIIPLVESDNMKTYLRLLSELPELNKFLIQKLKSLCIDPDRINLGFKGLQFLIMLRPPCKAHALELVEELYATGDEATRNQAEALLKKYKPEAVKEKEEQGQKEEAA